MAKRNVWWKQFVIAAFCSAMASLLIVAVGPGFSKNGNSNGAGAETASGKSADHDGDHDNSTSTAHEDGHDAEPGNSGNAHPSGEDRSEEKGGSGNQGKAESNPDDSKGPERSEGGRGDDKPQGPGGADRADQDGNNGCGNDDDFDDDNNGNCGKSQNSSPNGGRGNNDGNNGNRGSGNNGNHGNGNNGSNGNHGNGNNGSNGNHGNGNNGNGGGNGGGRTPVTICHRTGSTTNPWVVITVDDNALPAHQGHGDVFPSASGCPESPSGSDDNDDKKVTICHRTGSATNPFVVITVSVNAWPAHQAHGDTIWNGTSCSGSGGTTNPPDPNVDPDLCPAGTDMAGEPIPGNNVKSCNNGDDDGTPPDVVLGDDFDKGDDKPKVDDEVLADSSGERGETLPFTGANIIAYLVLALELVGAGILISRARKRQR